MMYILVKEKLTSCVGVGQKICKTSADLPYAEIFYPSKNVGIDPDEHKKHVKPSGALELCWFIISYWSKYFFSLRSKNIITKINMQRKIFTTFPTHLNLNNVDL